MSVVVINIKPSHRVRQKFVCAFPEATFYGSTTLGSKGKSYYIPLSVYESKRELIKKFGTTAKHQPFLDTPLPKPAKKQKDAANPQQSQINF